LRPSVCLVLASLISSFSVVVFALVDQLAGGG
jgi:hypothetical protein